MTSRDRQTLKNYFREGNLPTEEHFVDLVDSMLNMTDEGFRKGLEHGQELAVPTGRNALISFFRTEAPQTPAWSIQFGEDREQLVFRTPHHQPTDAQPTLATVLCLDQDKRVGINVDCPRAELDVGGAVRCESRLGSYPVESNESLLADGKWHPVLVNLQACQAFEIVAGAGVPGTGHFALVHAIAVNAYNPTFGLFEWFNRRRNIRCTHATYSRRADRIKLRWRGTSGRNANYRLEARSGVDFGKDCRIQVHVTRLWHDPHMQGAIAP